MIRFVTSSRYDFIKTTLLAHRLPIVDFQMSDNILLHLVSSCLAGMFATSESSILPLSDYPNNLYSTAVCSPADVIRSRLMAAVKIFLDSMSNSS